MNKEKFVLYRFFDGESKLKYAVLEKKEYRFIKISR